MPYIARIRKKPPSLALYNPGLSSPIPNCPAPSLSPLSHLLQMLPKPMPTGKINNWLCDIKLDVFEGSEMESDDL